MVNGDTGSCPDPSPFICVAEWWDMVTGLLKPFAQQTSTTQATRRPREITEEVTVYVALVGLQNKQAA